MADPLARALALGVRDLDEVHFCPAKFLWKVAFYVKNSDRQCRRPAAKAIAVLFISSGPPARGLLLAWGLFPYAIRPQLPLFPRVLPFRFPMAPAVGCFPYGSGRL
jgi:hypothetical protein